MAVMKFKDEFFSSHPRYSLGVEEVSGKKYISIPVSNTQMEYEEYYEVSPDVYKALLKYPELARSHAEKCRRRENDVNLILKPGEDRGRG